MGLFQVPWRADFSVGTGISDFTGLPAIKPWAFEDTAKKALNHASQPVQAVHGNITISKGIMSSTSHYKHALHASTSMSIKLWGAAAHAGSKLLTELELNSKTVHYVVVCNFDTETINKLDELEYTPTLSNSAEDLLVKVGPDKWAEQYGTHFIAGYVRGGTYTGKATITDHSTQGAHEFQADMGAKFGRFASASGSAGTKFGHLKEKQETKFDIECTGANLNLPQPATIEELVQFASNYTQNNMGVKHHAILLPFSALGSYNAAEAQYNGIRPLSWVESGTELLKDLNFEYVRLQRLKHVLMNNEHLETPSDAVYQDAKQKVQTALYSFDALKVPADIQKVNCSSEAYDKQLFDHIFVADAVEHMLGVDLSKLDVPVPPAPPPATHSAPEPAPAETKQASHDSSRDTLHSNGNSELAEGNKLESADKSYTLEMQRDGNLVCYNNGGPIWSTRTHNKHAGPFSPVMQSDRNLVIYGHDHKSIWSTKTCGHGAEPAQLVMQNDGNVVLYDGHHKPLWSSKSHK